MNSTNPSESLDIFISYSSADRPFVADLAASLRKRGWTVWWDRKTPVGQSFRDVLERQLSLARCVVVVWTDSSVGSDWVQNEAAEGKIRGVLVPVMLGKARLPLEFRHLQCADLSSWVPGETNVEFDEALSSIDQIIRAADSHPKVPPTELVASPAVEQKPSATPRTIRGASSPDSLPTIFVSYPFRRSDLFSVVESVIEKDGSCEIETGKRPYGLGRPFRVSIRDRIKDSHGFAAIWDAETLSPWLIWELGVAHAFGLPTRIFIHRESNHQSALRIMPELHHLAFPDTELLQVFSSGWPTFKNEVIKFRETLQGE